MELSLVVCKCGTLAVWQRGIKSGSVVVWNYVWQCVSVELWQCGSVELSLAVCKCGTLAVWQCGSVELSLAVW